MPDYVVIHSQFAEAPRKGSFCFYGIFLTYDL